MPFVVDTSVAVAWGLEDETSPFTDRVLRLLDGDSALVPAIWPLEMTNALMMAVRRQRLTGSDVHEFMEMVRGLPIMVVDVSLDRAFRVVWDLARAHQLTAYDAAYLDLAMREGLPLATQDIDLRAAAAQAGVALV